MCGRFTLTARPEALRELFPLLDPLEAPPRSNIAPTQTIAAVRWSATKEKAEWAQFRWGLVPSWAADLKVGYRLINARSEGIASKPTFRAAFKQRRCLIAADGFYEWRKEGKKKVPYHFRMRDSKPFAFAGLWEQWRSPDLEVIESCTIITTDANEVARPFHERMPVILPVAEHALWLDPAVQTDPRLQELLRPFPADAMAVVPAELSNP